MASSLKIYFSKRKNKKDTRSFPKKELFKYDIEEYDVTYAVPKTVLRLVGLRFMRKDSAFADMCWKVFYWFEFANLFIVTWLEIIQMVKTAQGGSFADAVEIFRMMPCVGYLLLAMVKSYRIVVYRPVYENLLNELRSMWPTSDITEEEHDIISKALKQLNYSIQGYYWCNNALLVVFLSPPFVEMIKRAMGRNVPLILPFFYWFPFDPFRRILYDTILVFQTWHGLISIWFMVSSDLLFCIFLSHITTQFDLLSVRIRKLIYVPVDTQLIDDYPLASYSHEYVQNKKHMIENCNDKDWETIHSKQLSEIMIRHRALIRLSGDVEDVFSFPLLVNFFNSSIIICFCGFCCVVVEKLTEMVYKSFLITALSQTWVLCWYGQRLLDSSTGVSRALYKSGWYKASKSIRSAILIMMHRGQKEVHVTTYGFSVISLASYTTIIKTAWSYFTLLLNVYKK